ncbi:MAG: VWA-like domain-containing protein [Eubacteriales bacterium]|nr:VWA-like domain-containing protein [Eubacteriales bacterium]
MQDVFAVLDRVCFALMEKEPFYGYFLMQMKRVIKEDLPSPTGSFLRAAQFQLVIAPASFMRLSFSQQCGCIKHEILHLIADHHKRSRRLLTLYPALAVSFALDICVNQHLKEEELPPFATTLASVNAALGLSLIPFGTLEEYAETIATALRKREQTRSSSMMENDGQTDFLGLSDEQTDRIEQKRSANRDEREEFDTERSRGGLLEVFEPEHAHDLWQQSDEVEDEVRRALLDRLMRQAAKGGRPLAVGALLKDVDGYRPVLSWQHYLKRLVGEIAHRHKKVSTRRDRRQPQRMDIRGVLRSHRPRVVVAVDISASMTQEAFQSAMLEVWQIAKVNQAAVTVVECDDHIRRIYEVKKKTDIVDRKFSRGQTLFSPVIAYANQQRADLCVYFTDGKGEGQLAIPPQGYPLLWILTDPADRLSVKQAFGAVRHLAPQTKKQWVDELDVPRGGFSMNAQEK